MNLKIFFSFLPLLLLGGCYSVEPLIKEEVEKISIACLESDEIIVIEDKGTIEKLRKEVNGSRREGSEEMEFPSGHHVIYETVSGDEVSFTFWDGGGKSLIQSYYVHSNIQDFCDGEK